MGQRLQNIQKTTGTPEMDTSQLKHANLAWLDKSVSHGSPESTLQTALLQQLLSLLCVLMIQGKRAILE